MSQQQIVVPHAKPIKGLIVFSGVLLVALGVAYGRKVAGARMKACVYYMRCFEGMKAQWALENKAGPEARPTWDDLRPYCKSGGPPHGEYCPSGGVWTIGMVKEDFSCSIPRHQAAFLAGSDEPTR